MLEKSTTPYQDLRFVPSGEGNPVEAALLRGDPATGPVAFLVRMPAGDAEPWHSHTSTCRAVLIGGEFRSRGKDAATDFAEIKSTERALIWCNRAARRIPRSTPAIGRCWRWSSLKDPRISFRQPEAVREFRRREIAVLGRGRVRAVDLLNETAQPRARSTLLSYSPE